MPRAITRFWKRSRWNSCVLGPGRWLPLFLLLLLTAANLAGVDWQTRRYGDTVIRCAPRDTTFAGLMARRLNRRADAVQMQLGVYPDGPLNITIVPDQKEYRKVTLGKGKLVESSQAFYSPRERVIYVSSPQRIEPADYDQVLMHEYMHWFLDETLTGAPLWFHEGMAMLYSGQFGFHSYYEFTRYRFMGYRLSLPEMERSYPAERSRWNMFYLTSAFAVSHMRSGYKTGWEDFWSGVGANYGGGGQDRKTSFRAAFLAGYRMSPYSFSLQFDRTLRRYGWLFPLIGVNAVVFALLPFVIIAGWWRGRRRLKGLPDLPEPPGEEENTPE